MIALILAATLALPAASCADADGLPADTTLRALYRTGQDFDRFLAGADRRRALWLENWERSQDLDPALVERARAVDGSWRFLVIAVAGCSDSVSTIPYLARLVEQVEGLEMRIVDSTAGRAVMEAHPTPDGRAATPTILLLDEAWDEAGCFIERPAPLQSWITERRGRMSDGEIYRSKLRWYEDDAGHSTLQQIVALLESAATGDPHCRIPSPGS